MSQLNLNLPIIGEPNATEDPKVRTALSDIQTVVNALDNTNIASAAGINGSKLLDSSIATAKLANDAVTAAKIAADAVGSSEIAANAVGTAEIADDAVTSPKLNLTTSSASAGIATLFDNAPGGANAITTSELSLSLAAGIYIVLAVLDVQIDRTDPDGLGQRLGTPQLSLHNQTDNADISPAVYTVPTAATTGLYRLPVTFASLFSPSGTKTVRIRMAAGGATSPPDPSARFSVMAGSKIDAIKIG